MHDVISPAQSAFIKGRQISDNILLAQELFRNYHSNKGPPRCAVKVDLRKAYDTIRWEFIIDILDIMCFPACFVHWIKSCITTPYFSININGELEGFFPGSRGLRQGDPISPYLFVLGMDVLSMILEEAVQHSHFTFHWRCSDLNISHLCFADDLLLFSSGDVNSVSILKAALDCFSAFSGLLPNDGKSNIFMSGIEPLIAAEISGLLGFSTGSLPMRYLGVPLISTKLKFGDCKALIDRLLSKIRNWTNNYLSYAGRLQLIKSVLFNVQMFWSSHFILPKKVITHIEQIMRKFLWSGSDMRSFGAKVAWSDVCCTIEEGGLGLKDPSVWNKAMMAKHLWNIQQPNPPSLWVRWVRHYLLKDRSLWELNIPQSCSWTWRKLLKLRGSIRPYIKHIVGNGSSTFLWYDYWLPTGPILPAMSERVLYDSCLPRNARVGCVIHDSDWSWPSPFSHSIRVISDNIPANFIPRPDRSDSVIWLPSNGTFSVSSAWEVLRQHHVQVEWFHVIWHPMKIPKASFILWLAIRKKLSTLDRMIGIGLPTNDRCYFCHHTLESHDHLFFNCPFTFRIWSSLLQKLDLYWTHRCWDDTVLWVAQNSNSRSLDSILLKLSLAAAVYCIWRERNSRWSSGSLLTDYIIVTHVEDLIRLRLARSRFKWSMRNLHLKLAWNLHDNLLL